MEDHLARSTEKFCEHMFAICTLIKSTDKSTALQGLQLISAVRGVFVMGLAVGMDCPVMELFSVQHARLSAMNAEDGVSGA